MNSSLPRYLPRADWHSYSVIECGFYLNQQSCKYSYKTYPKLPQLSSEYKTTRHYGVKEKDPEDNQSKTKYKVPAT